MKYKIFLLVPLGILIFISLIFINKTNEEKAANIQPDYSENRTIKEQGNNILINFASCTQDKRRKDVEFGSTTIAIIGKTGESCIIRYGGEVENPNWNGILPIKCTVPQSLGEVEFTTSNDGVNFQPIEKYCSE